jgi:hypothetical protein
MRAARGSKKGIAVVLGMVMEARRALGAIRAPGTVRPQDARADTVTGTDTDTDTDTDTGTGTGTVTDTVTVTVTVTATVVALVKALSAGAF